MLDGRKVLLSALLASLAAPVGLGILALASNLERYGKTDLATVMHYGMAIWLFSLVAVLAGAILILLLRKVFAGKVSPLVLATAVTVALVLGAFLGLDRESALSLSMVAGATLLAFLLAWRVVG